MGKDLHRPVVAIIVLNYNSWQDTIECVTLLLKQDWPDFMVVVVDNASSDGSVNKLKSAWTSGNGIKYLAEYEKGEAEYGGVAKKEDKLLKYQSQERLVLIKNDTNLGYSAGNNVGIRYAIKRGAAAVLIINPDIRIEDPAILNEMVNTLFSRDDVFVVAPNVIDAEGRRQNPLREPGFFEECINPFVAVIMKRLGGTPPDYIEPLKSENPYEVEKVNGSCILMPTSFLTKIRMLDENVFLYSEEPILMSKVREHGGKIVYLPSIAVKHLHRANKANVSQYKHFIKSRLYFLSKYKKYNFIQISLMKLSYGVVLIFKMLRSTKQD